MNALRTVIRLLTGRVAYERRAMLLAVQIAPQFTDHPNQTELQASRIARFLLTGEFSD